MCADTQRTGDLTTKYKPETDFHLDASFVGPIPALKTYQYFQIQPEDTRLVVNSGTDVKAAKTACFILFCVPYGYRNQLVESFNPCRITESLAEILV